jgi:hypothetical protein
VPSSSVRTLPWERDGREGSVSARFWRNQTVGVD